MELKILDTHEITNVTYKRFAIMGLGISIKDGPSLWSEVLLVPNPIPLSMYYLNFFFNFTLFVG